MAVVPFVVVSAVPRLLLHKAPTVLCNGRTDGPMVLRQHRFVLPLSSSVFPVGRLEALDAPINGVLLLRVHPVLRGYIMFATVAMTLFGLLLNTHLIFSDVFTVMFTVMMTFIVPCIGRQATCWSLVLVLMMVRLRASGTLLLLTLPVLELR